MAFTDPAFIEHLDTVTLAQWQQVADNLAYLRDAVNPVHLIDGGFDRDSADTSHKTFHHFAKFLIYKEANNDDPILMVADMNSNLTQDLSPVGSDAEPDAVGIQDLSDVDWLQPGMVYHVTNVLYAFESFYI